LQLLLLLLALFGAALSLAGLALGSRWLALAGAAAAVVATAVQYLVGDERSADAMAGADAPSDDNHANLVAAARRARRSKLAPLALAVATAFVYFVSNPRPQDYFDYTFRIACALLGGQAGLTEQPPSWLNEMVPHGGRFYSVFPLGSVLSMLPAALLKEAGVVETFPASLVAAVVAGAMSLLLYLVSLRYDLTPRKRLLLVAFVSFGTWAWCNLSFAGSWQIALGLAVVGQLGALYFTLIKPRPLLAGLFFALAYGNRTEIILLAPVFMYLACRDSIKTPPEIVACWPTLLKFSASPFLLGAATLAYNYSRFGSPFDFGYARIPGVLNEPWYRDGLFSLSAVPRNAWAMLFETWRVVETRPYLVPKGFGGSIFLASPLLLLLFRRGARDFGLKRLAWIAIALLVVVLWLHGNPGGWQFSYRYAMILLPWMFLILAESGPRFATLTETALAAVSVAVNAYATYLFHWTDRVQP
jgi:hypothetical protein